MDDRSPPPAPGASSPVGEELAEAECLALLRTRDVARLAVRLPGDGVDIFPVNFVIHQESVLLRTGSGTKMDSLIKEPLVAFQSDEVDHESGVAWSVVVKGYAFEVIRHDELFELLNVTLETLDPQRKPHFVRIRQTSITGRRYDISDAF